MKVITVFPPDGLRQETLDALEEFWQPKALYLYEIEKANEFAYGEILAGHWRMGEDMFIVEPDIVIRPDVVEAAILCGCEYGCFPYPWLTDIGPALGCTWFKSSFIRRYPEAMDEVLAEGVSWRQLDVVLMRHRLARDRGEQPHVHLPPVVHLNERKQLLPEASRTPLMEVPHW
jgi:hypothetical protein